MFSASIPNGFEATNVVILVKLHYYESALGQKHKSFLRLTTEQRERALRAVLVSEHSL